ncbi:MAG: biotin/lipoyl-binding protein, partial [Pirellulales bacterium]|nr:biotin/lipoyl-binding protein [Pirellulales bacterium]
MSEVQARSDQRHRRWKLERTVPVQPAVDLRLVHNELAELTAAPQDEETITGFLELSVKFTSAIAVGYLGRDGGQPVLFEPQRGMISQPSQQWYWSQLSADLTAAQQQRAPQVTMSEGEPKCAVVTVPIAEYSDSTSSLGVILHQQDTDVNDPNIVQQVVIVLHTVGAYVAQWRLHQDNNELNDLDKYLAALVELLEKLYSCVDVKLACMTVSNEVQKYLGVDQVVVAMRRRPNAPVKIQAMSGVARLTTKSTKLKDLENALVEATIDDSLKSWPPLESDGRHLSIAHRAVVDHQHARSIISAPLQTADGKTIGAWAFLGKPNEVQSPQAVCFMNAATQGVAAALSMVKTAAGGRLRRLARFVLRFSFFWKFLAICSVLGLVGGLLTLPFSHRISCSCELEPVVRSFAVVPYDGLLEGGNVRPGDVVQKGQVLASMDTREIRWELAGLKAEHAQAAKKRDVGLAN